MLAGFGADNIIKVATDEHDAIIAEKMPVLDESTIVCLQAGNVKTGAIDPIKDICLIAKEKGAYVHIDGALVCGQGFLPKNLNLQRDVN